MALVVALGSIAPLGAMVGWSVIPRLTVDVAGGYSLRRGPRIGTRLRYQFSEHLFSPFVGLGTYVNPADHQLAPLELIPSGTPAKTYYAGWFLTPMAGAVLHERDGGFALLGLGYSTRLTGKRDTVDHHVAIELAGGVSF